MGISPELFEEICAKAVAIYRLSRTQIAPAPTPSFQASRDHLTLAAAVQNTINLYAVEGRIDLTEQGWTDLRFWVKKEAIQILRLGSPKEKVQAEPEEKPGAARHHFLYKRLKIGPKDFRQYYGVGEDEFWKMLAYVSEQYQKSWRKNVKEPPQHQRTQSRAALLDATRQIAQQAGIEELQQRNLRSALLSIAGRAGAYAAYLARLQPELTLTA